MVKDLAIKMASSQWLFRINKHFLYFFVHITVSGRDEILSPFSCNNILGWVMPNSYYCNRNCPILSTGVFGKVERLSLFDLFVVMDGNSSLPACCISRIIKIFLLFFKTDRISDLFVKKVLMAVTRWLWKKYSEWSLSSYYVTLPIFCKHVASQACTSSTSDRCPYPGWPWFAQRIGIASNIKGANKSFS